MNFEYTAQSGAFSDKELVSLAKEGDSNAFSILSERYLPVLKSKAGRYSNVVGVDTEDFIQEGMLALFKAVKGYDAGMGILFKTYAVTCINNSMTTAIKAHMKNLSANVAVSIDAMPEAELHKTNAAQQTQMLEDVFIAKQDSALRAVQLQAVLSGFEQQALKLYLRGHSYKQISHLLSTSTKAVDNALQRVRRKLRPEL